MMWGWSDMTDVLWLMGCRHDNYRVHIMPYPAPQGYPSGQEALFIYFLLQKQFL